MHGYTCDSATQAGQQAQRCQAENDARSVTISSKIDQLDSTLFNLTSTFECPVHELEEPIFFP